ncbi:MAG: uracil-DNA glycosylase [Pararhodobacter sp.]
MTAGMDWHLARALLEWQVELGATEAIGDSPIDRFAPIPPARRSVAPAVAAGAPAYPVPGPVGAAPVSADPAVDAVADAARLAAAAADLPALAEALAGFAHCELRLGARRCVFADGRPEARVMIIGEAPGREEDRIGKPFVGPAGQLLDQIFAAIGMARDHPDPARALYVTNPVPWRPPGNREPTEAELAMLRPFLERHIALAAPDILVLTGNIACQAVLQMRGITRLRGRWHDWQGLPVLPTFHPSNLLRRPENKREVWADMLTLQARLRETA